MMRAVLTKDEYMDFVESVDLLRIRADISITHSVEYKDGKFIITLLDEYDWDGLDQILIDNGVDL